MKVNTQVEINDDKLLQAIAKEFIVEIGLIHEEYNNGYSSRYEIGREAKFLVRDLIKTFLKENKEEICYLAFRNSRGSMDLSFWLTLKCR